MEDMDGEDIKTVFLTDFERVMCLAVDDDGCACSGSDGSRGMEGIEGMEGEELKTVFLNDFERVRKDFGCTRSFMRSDVIAVMHTIVGFFVYKIESHCSLPDTISNAECNNLTSDLTATKCLE